MWGPVSMKHIIHVLYQLSAAMLTPSSITTNTNFQLPCVRAYQAIIVQVQDVHALSNLLIHSVQLSLNAAEDARHLVSQTLLRHNLLQLVRPLHLKTTQVAMTVNIISLKLTTILIY